jgi:hypothetical protein
LTARERASWRKQASQHSRFVVAARSAAAPKQAQEPDEDCLNSSPQNNRCPMRSHLAQG